MSGPSVPTFYPGQTQADMEQRLRADYLTKSGWLESATTKLAVRHGKPLPWFTYASIEFLERNIDQSLRVFEYGGGQSSLWWAERVSHVATVDHSPDYYAYVESQRPKNSSLFLREENGKLEHPRALAWKAVMPEIKDPERDDKTYRSGQLNHSFASYAFKLAEYEPGSFDIVVVDGMARVLSTWAAIQHFKSHNFIIFDNSDRDMYSHAYQLLEEKGHRRLDFWGLGPVNPYEWCTSVFYKARDFVDVKWFPKAHTAPLNTSEASSSEALPEQKNVDAPQIETETRESLSTSKQQNALGILVLAYNRPHHLQSVLESLRLQNKLDNVHIWIDGTQGLSEFKGIPDKTVEIARRYSVKEVRVPWGHFGIDKHILAALTVMSDSYKRVLILEDDCFPIEGAVDLFDADLKAVQERDDIYSVYGHHFEIEPHDTRDFSRFQGWGWGANSYQLKRILPELKELFLLDEESYKTRAKEILTAEVRSRIDVTKGRDVIKVLETGYSWDAVMTMLCGRDQLKHRRTEKKTIHNTGITEGIGHFTADSNRLRAPPFNMITLSEAWRHWDQTTQPCDMSRDSYGLRELDKNIMAAIPIERGVFVEIGAHDGVTQNNSILLEKKGWSGLLIEACPASFAKCSRSRPSVMTEHAACVAAGYRPSHLKIVDVGLMSVSATSDFSEERKVDWLERGEGFNKRPRQEIEVEATQISKLFDKHGLHNIDLLILDVEGAEVDVLKGLDFERHAPAWVVAEDTYDDAVHDYLAQQRYELVEVLMESKHTRDRLYKRC